jgi:hypothetical protein
MNRPPTVAAWCVSALNNQDGLVDSSCSNVGEERHWLWGGVYGRIDCAPHGTPISESIYWVKEMLQRYQLVYGIPALTPGVRRKELWYVGGRGDVLDQGEERQMLEQYGASWAEALHQWIVVVQVPGGRLLENRSPRSRNSLQIWRLDLAWEYLRPRLFEHRLLVFASHLEIARPLITLERIV